jgi:hypothetical protein
MDALTSLGTNDHAFRLEKVSFACAEIVALAPKINAAVIGIEHAQVAGSLAGIGRHADELEIHAKSIATLAAAVRRGVEG